MFKFSSQKKKKKVWVGGNIIITICISRAKVPLIWRYVLRLMCVVRGFSQFVRCRYITILFTFRHTMPVFNCPTLYVRFLLISHTNAILVLWKKAICLKIMNYNTLFQNKTNVYRSLAHGVGEQSEDMYLLYTSIITSRRGRWIMYWFSRAENITLSEIY